MSRSRLWCLRSNEARQASTRALASSANASLWVGTAFLCGWDHPRRGEPSTCTRTSDFLEHHYTTHSTTEQTSKKLPASGSEAQTSAFSFPFAWCHVTAFILWSFISRKEVHVLNICWFCLTCVLLPSPGNSPPVALRSGPAPLSPRLRAGGYALAPGRMEYASTLASGTPALGLSPRLGQPALFPGTLHRCWKAVGRDTDFEKRGIWGHCSHVPHHVEHE